MSKARKQRRFRRWRNYRRQCVEATGEKVPLTMGMCKAWMQAHYRIADGRFWTMPLWHDNRKVPIGNWEKRRVAAS